MRALKEKESAVFISLNVHQRRGCYFRNELNKL